MTNIINFFAFIGLLIIVLFIVTLITFYFFRKRKLDKIKIIEYIHEEEKAFSTYNINEAIFKGKKIKYTISLLQELEKENLIINITTNNIKENSIWKYKKCR
ncbi:hypothetical protein [Senegalia massiliensis]|uniref:Uncharacterized protein n=1 Tax=Senegalia massiliensis TaxID=1720316 RepID=A0A845QSW3_9CLOT|nr:hypothetical protein [Senegalia massiliensis]NBI05291.1 hypothetical protein [Senegalia massiliensis]